MSLESDSTDHALTEQQAAIRAIQSKISVTAITQQAFFFVAIAIAASMFFPSIELWPFPTGQWLAWSSALGACVGLALGMVCYALAAQLSKWYRPLQCLWAIQILAPIAPTHRNFLYLALLVGSYEEIVFRGVVQQGLGFLFATTVFVLIHAGYLIAAPNRQAKVIYLVYMAALSALFGLVYIWFGLAACIAMHIMYDYLAFYGLLPTWQAAHEQWLEQRQRDEISSHA